MILILPSSLILSIKPTCHHFPTSSINAPPTTGSVLFIFLVLSDSLFQKIFTPIRSLTKAQHSTLPFGAYQPSCTPFTCTEFPSGHIARLYTLLSDIFIVPSSLNTGSNCGAGVPSPASADFCSLA